MESPLVSIICIDCTPEYIDMRISEQTYQNLEAFEIIGSELNESIPEAFSIASGKYICFMESGQFYDAKRIEFLVNFLEKQKNLDIAVCTRIFVDDNEQIIAHDDIAYHDSLHYKSLPGKLLLETCINDNVNLYGNLSTMLIRSEYAKKCNLNYDSIPKSLYRTATIYQLLMNSHIGFLYIPFVATFLKEASSKNSHTEHEYRAYVELLADELNIVPLKNTRDIHSLKKEITFFCTDNGEYYNIKPIADEAKRRGYKVKYTEDKGQKAEIGVYCQHICYPENSKFSVILLHDMEQTSEHWPNIWEVERWQGFDLGILPNKYWRERWEQCGGFYYANPRNGVYELGYPKSDIARSKSLKERAKKLKKELNLKYEYSILYAPSWENDGKEDDFVQSLCSLNANLLVKQAAWFKRDFHSNNYKKMRELHDGKYENLYYIEPEENIMVALEICDLVVSDESSVMTEALMFEKPSIAVMDWIIPDTEQGRFPCVPVDYVLKCKKSTLLETVCSVMQDKKITDNLMQIGHGMYSNIGSCSKDIMDAIDYYTFKTDEEQECVDLDFLNKKLVPKYEPSTLWN